MSLDAQRIYTIIYNAGREGASTSLIVRAYRGSLTGMTPTDWARFNFVYDKLAKAGHIQIRTYHSPFGPVKNLVSTEFEKEDRKKTEWNGCLNDHP